MTRTQSYILRILRAGGRLVTWGSKTYELRSRNGSYLSDHLTSTVQAMQAAGFLDEQLRPVDEERAAPGGAEGRS